MEHARVFRTFAPWPPVAENGGGSSHQLGLNKKITEDGMR
jgi:hypothetical protein